MKKKKKKSAEQPFCFWSYSARSSALNVRYTYTYSTRFLHAIIRVKHVNRYTSDVKKQIYPLTCKVRSIFTYCNAQKQT